MKYSNLSFKTEKLDGKKYTLWPTFVTIRVHPCDEFASRTCSVSTEDDSYAERHGLLGSGTTTAISQYGAQMEITAWMAENGYFPAPGRVGRWHNFDNQRRRVFERSV